MLCYKHCDRYAEENNLIKNKSLKTKLELAQLWNCVLSGDVRAFEILHEELYPGIYKSVLRLTKDEDVASDLVQDLFVRMWTKRSKIGNIDCVNQYFMISAKSIVFNHLKKRSIFTVSLQETSSTLCDPSPENVMIEKETDLLHIKNFNTALSNLPHRQREVLVMKYHLGYSYGEIEEKTGIRYQSIANHLYRATIKLKSDLGALTKPGKYFTIM